MKLFQTILLFVLTINIVSAQQSNDEIFKVVEQMPCFPGCDTGSNYENDNCTKEKLINYITKNLVYPDSALVMKIEGKVVVQFVIESDGQISNAKVVRDIGYGCGDAAINVIMSMNSMPKKWTPGKQRGRSIRLLYTLPITFNLP